MRWLVPALILLALALSAATQTFASLMAWRCWCWDAALGAPLWVHATGLRLYPPWAIVPWAWWWAGQAPHAFVWPALVGVSTAVGAALAVWGSRQRTTGEAHWATWGELRRAACLGRPGRGIVLGRRRGRTLRYHGVGHVLIVAATQTGKSSGIVIPTLLEDRRSMVVHDVKGELVEATAGYRAHALGQQVVQLAPLEETGWTWNPWAGVRLDTDLAYRDAELISQYLIKTDIVQVRSSGGLHFQALAIQAFTGLSLYGLTTGLAICGADFNDLVTTLSWEGLAQSMQEHDHPEVQRAAAVMTRQGKEQLGDLQSTLSNALRLWCDPRVARMTQESRFQWAMLREQDQPCTVYWHVPFPDQERLRPLTRLFFQQALDHCISRRAGWQHRIAFVLDELPSLERFTPTSKGLNYVAGYGVQLILATPSMKELLEQYGQYHNFFDGCRVQVFFGLYDPKTAEHVEGRLGTHTVRRRRPVTQGGKRQTSREERREALLDATGVLQLDEDEALVLAGRYATRVQQVRFYRDRPWRQRAGWAVSEKEEEDGK